MKMAAYEFLSTQIDEFQGLKIYFISNKDHTERPYAQICHTCTFIVSKMIK